MKYLVDISRIDVKIRTFEVDANDIKDAEDKAIKEAYNINWDNISGGSVEYGIEHIEEVE